MSLSVEKEEECHRGVDTPQSLESKQQDIGIEINSENKKLKTLIEEPPKFDLKKLPDHLEYAFLVEGSKLPVIISSHLKCDKKGRLMEVLKQHKRVIAWKITDIKGINPSFCTLIILQLI